MFTAEGRGPGMGLEQELFRRRMGEMRPDGMPPVERMPMGQPMPQKRFPTGLGPGMPIAPPAGLGAGSPMQGGPGFFGNLMSRLGQFGSKLNGGMGRMSPGISRPGTSPIQLPTGFQTERPDPSQFGRL